MPHAANVILVHGAWTDGSSWGRVITLLEEKGFRATAVQLPLTGLPEDAAVVRHVLSLQKGPAVLVGHAYGGAVISEAADAKNVRGLVFVSAFAPEVEESVNDLGALAPAPGFEQVRSDNLGWLWLDRAGFREAFAQDVGEDQAGVLAAVQKPIEARAFADRLTHAAWKSKPSWFLISENDRMVPPQTQHFMAERAHGQVRSVPAGHASYVAYPHEVAALIAEAAAA